MATTTAGAFVNASRNGYKVGTSATTAVQASTGDNSVSPVISNDLGDKKVLVGINVIVAYLDVAATLIVEGSTDASNWVTLATASSDVAPNVTGVKLYLVDLSSIRAPYYRLKFNGGGLNVGTSGTLKFIYAAEVEYKKTITL